MAFFVGRILCEQGILETLIHFRSLEHIWLPMPVVFDERCVEVGLSS